MEIKNINDVDFLRLNREVTLIVAAQNAKLGPPVGPILGQVKIKVKDFCTAFNETTNSYPNGLPLKVVVFVYKNETFDFIILGPSISFLLKNALKFKKRNTLSLLDLYKVSLIKSSIDKETPKHLIFRNVLAISKSMKITIEK